MATKISKKQLGDDVLRLLQSGGGGGSLDKDIVSNTALGATPAGSVFSMGLTFTEFAEKLLRRDITPTISTSFSNSGTKEKGTVVNGTQMVLNITNLSSVTVPINEINFYIGNTKVNTVAFQSGKSSYSFNYTENITQDTTAKAEVIYNGNYK